MRAHRSGLVAMAMALAVAGCGTGSDGEPRAISSDQVPFGLLDPSTTTTTTSPVAATVPASVYLVDGDGVLTQVRREVEAPLTIGRALESLLEQVSTAEAEEGLRSSIPSGTELRDFSAPEAGIVTIDLSSSIDNVTGEPLRRALAQIVWTATAVPEVNRILIAVDGEPREVPDGNGVSTATPLSRTDYAVFTSRPTTTTSPPENDQPTSEGP
ncbi:MAG TPA: GerMN domain-containing protein [Acidimicrobiales bacterium]|nr:GerMN domain-containing protein [Acidimicrobiales bacterium]